MKPEILTFAAVLLSVITLSSCLGDNDNEYVLSQNVAITSVKLGTLNRYIIGKKSDGTDSLYKRTIDCSSLYPMYINQLTREIYNPDSLPGDIDTRHVIINISYLNGSTIGLKSLTSDSLRNFTSSDSVDFTQPRWFYLYSQDGSGYTKYLIKLNKHNEDGDAFAWNKVTAENPFEGNVNGMRATSTGTGKLVVMATDGSRTSSYVFNEAKTSWSRYDMAGDTQCLNSLITKNYKAFTIADGNLYQYDNSWTVTKACDLKQLMGATNYRLYGIDNDGNVVSSADDGDSWETETLDADAALLPNRDVFLAYRKLMTNERTNQLTIVGNIDSEQTPNDSTAVIWNKVEENTENARKHNWAYAPFASDNRCKLPRLENLQVANFDDGMIAIGSLGTDEDGLAQLSQIYFSQDNGLTWHVDSNMALPEDFKPKAGQFAMTVDSANFIWLISASDGQLWKGRFNRLGWEKHETSFVE